MLQARKDTSLFSVICLLLLAPLGAGCPKAESDDPPGSTPPPTRDAASGGNADSSNGSPVDAEPEEDVVPPPMRDAAPPDPTTVNACTLLRTGPYVPLMGQAIFNSMSPATNLETKAYRVTIPARMSTHLNFAVPKAGSYYLYVSNPVSVALFTIDGLQLDPESFRTRINECMEVKGRYDFTGLSAAQYVVRLGPVTTTPITVDLVIGEHAP